MAMTLQARRTVILAVVMAVGLGLAVSATPAGAHSRPAPPPPAADVVTSDPLVGPGAAPVPALPAAAPLAPALALGAGLAMALVLRRRAVVTALALVLVVLAVETGVHSVHHLADQEGGAECVVALATAQVHGTAEPPPADHHLWIAVPGGTVGLSPPERPGARPLRPDEGRAPPTT